MNEHVTTNAHKVKSYSVPQSQPPTHQTSITLTLTLTQTTIQKPQYHNTTRTLHPATDPAPNQTTLGQHPTKQSSTHTKQYHQPHKPPPTTTASLYTYTLPHTHTAHHTQIPTPHHIQSQTSIRFRRTYTNQPNHQTHAHTYTLTHTTYPPRFISRTYTPTHTNHHLNPHTHHRGSGTRAAAWRETSRSSAPCPVRCECVYMGWFIQPHLPARTDGRSPSLDRTTTKPKDGRTLMYATALSAAGRTASKSGPAISR